MPINAYTNLTRTGVHGGPYRTLNGTWMGLGNGEGSGRFYTKYELREIVRYAWRPAATRTMVRETVAAARQPTRIYGAIPSFC